MGVSQVRLRKRTRRIGSVGLKWAVATVAPWALSMGLLVSFTASAGQNYDGPGLPYSLVHRTPPAFASALPEGPSLLIAASSFRLPGLALQSSFRQAHLSFSDPERVIAIDPRQPREDLKRAAKSFPEVNRSAKSDPLPGLRPSLTGRFPGELEQVVFGDTQPKLISAGFTRPAPDAEPGQELQIGFVPYANDQGLTDPAASDASPHALRPLITSPRQAELYLESVDGSTPSVSLRSASTSSTPAVTYNVATLAPVSAPLQVSLVRPEGLAKTPNTGSSAIRKQGDTGREIYTGLIQPEQMAREQRCLAEAVYFEARSESDEGRAAVAQVVLNRVKSPLYPNTVCGVVYQNSNRHLACQFTFTCEGKSLRITEPGPWRDAVRIAREVYEGTTYLSEVGASTHYHANYVRPYWAKKLKKMDTIGQHIFYKLKPGQT